MDFGYLFGTKKEESDVTKVSKADKLNYFMLGSFVCVEFIFVAMFSVQYKIGMNNLVHSDSISHAIGYFL